MDKRLAVGAAGVGVTTYAADTGAAAMPMDAWRRGRNLVLTFALPGVDPSSIDVHLHGQILTVSANYGAPPDSGDVEVLVGERVHGLQTRHVDLGSPAVEDAISATFAAGLLRVTVPSPRAVVAWQPIAVTFEPGTQEDSLAVTRQNAPSLSSVARELLSETFPNATDEELASAADTLASSILHEGAVLPVDLAQSEETAHALADLHGGEVLPVDLAQSEETAHALADILGGHHGTGAVETAVTR